MINLTVPLERGCGMREKGGLYACCGTSPFGKPVEEFLIDPPLPFKGEPFRAPIVECRDGIKHLVFWVGKEFYPFCPDYIEETRRLGASKRVPVDLDLSGLEPFKSRMFFIHPRAIADVKERVDFCPKNNTSHINGDEFCIRSLYYFVDAEPEDGKYVREIGSISYEVPWLIRSKKPGYSAGMFLSLPFTHLEYVLPDDGMVDERVKRARDEGRPIEFVKE